jgi:glucoamylase
MLINAMEQFTSEGGMICEQIWDEADKPEEHMYFGQPSGSAMPLAWAHAEYIKLLRSVADGRIFDQIPAVVEHFSKPRQSVFEFWKLRRHLEQIEAGKTLRIAVKDRFRVDYTLNGWNDVEHTEATGVLHSGYFADIPVPVEQTAPVSFTLYWLEEQRWEGRNYDVQVTRPAEPPRERTKRPAVKQKQFA